MVLEKFRSTESVTICLPLFLAGGKEERAFARDYPIITGDGCIKMRAKIATECYSEEPASSIIVSDSTKNSRSKNLGCRRKSDDETLAVARQVADRIAEEIDGGSEAV